MANHFEQGDRDGCDDDRLAERRQNVTLARIGGEWPRLMIQDHQAAFPSTDADDIRRSPGRRVHH